MVRMEKLLRGRKRKQPSLPTHARTLRSANTNTDIVNESKENSKARDAIKQKPVGDNVEKDIKKQKLQEKTSSAISTGDQILSTSRSEEEIVAKDTVPSSENQDVEIKIILVIEEKCLGDKNKKDAAREITLSNFVNSRKPVIFSVLSLMPHRKHLITFARSIFGIYEDKITSGKHIDDNESKILLDFLTQKCRNRTNLTIDGSNTYLEKVFEFKPINGPSISVYLDSVLRLMELKNDGWLDGCLTDLWEFYHECGATIQVPTLWKYTPPRINDSFLTDIIENSDWDDTHKLYFHHIRVYLQLLTFSDLVVIDKGSQILLSIQKCERTRESTLDWPDSLPIPQKWKKSW